MQTNPVVKQNKKHYMVRESVKSRMTGTVPVEIREESGMKQRRRKTKEGKKSSGQGDGEQVSMDKEMESKCQWTRRLRASVNGQGDGEQVSMDKEMESKCQWTRRWRASVNGQGE